MSCLLVACGGGEPGEASAQQPGAGEEAVSSRAVCRVAGAARPLPLEVRETSGLARSRREPSIFWTHNDRGHDSRLFALDAEGRLVRTVSLPGVEAVDWEDIEAGGCEGGPCLWVADIGDNDAERDRITIYRIADPGSGTGETGPAEALHARFPDGPEDAEALFALPGGELFLVTKGRRGPIVLYRLPAPGLPGETVTLERVRQLLPEPEAEVDRVSAATATPDGRWVAIRTYRTLYLFPTPGLLGAEAMSPTVVDLRPLAEPQGEGLAMADDGSVWLSSEAESGRDVPRWSRLRCSLPDY